MEELMEKTQTISIPCANYVLNNYESLKGDYGSIANNRNTVCKNKITRAGEIIGLLSPDVLTTYKDKNDDTWCLTYGDLEEAKIDSINPYTGKSISDDEMTKLVIQKSLPHTYAPLNVALRQASDNDSCPIFHSHDPSIGYTFFPHTKTPLTMESILPGFKLRVSRHLNPMRSLPTKSWEDIGEDIYKVRVNGVQLSDNPAVITDVPASYIQDIVRVYDSTNDIVDLRKNEIPFHLRTKIPEELKYDLNRFLSIEDTQAGDEEHFSIPADMWVRLAELNLVPPEPVEVMIGINFDRSIKNSKDVVGTSLQWNLDAFTVATTNLCSAIGRAMRYTHGAVVTTLATSHNVVIDLRQTKMDFSAIILFPGIYEVQIDTITYPYAPFAYQRPWKVELDLQDPVERTMTILNDIFDLLNSSSKI